MTGLTWTNALARTDHQLSRGLWVRQPATPPHPADTGSIGGTTVAVGAVLFVAAGATFVWVSRRR